MTVAIFSILTLLALVLMLAGAVGWGATLIVIGAIVFALIAGQDEQRRKDRGW
jgi:hypothetical protein